MESLVYGTSLNEEIRQKCVKGKSKVHSRRDPEGSEGEKMCSSTLSVTSATDGGWWSTPRAGRFTSGKPRYSLYKRLGGPQGWSGRVRKISLPPGFDHRTDRLVASRYTD